MRSYFLILPLLHCMLVASCSDNKDSKKERSNKDFFTETKISVDFENEMATGETDFLRALTGHTISWQKWDQKILQKAKDTQRPIFALLCSPLGDSSRAVANELNENQALREMVSRLPVCTVIDANVNPEMAMLGYHLSNEIGRATAFPMMMWLSHEGSPIAWIPVGQTSGRELESLVSNSVAMVEDIWTKSSRYAVENSRIDNESRQLRLTPKTEELEEPLSRDELFRRETRQLSSLYSFGDKDLDFIGGLIPTNSIELLAIGSHSASLAKDVREQSRTAAKELTRELISGALKDPLDSSYFYARRTGDWTLPSFSKDLFSQAKVATMLLRVGKLLDEDQFTMQGLDVLAVLEAEWLTKQISSISPKGDADLPGAFLWDFRTLKKILNEDELKVATTAFSLEPTGNIPLETDPLGNYFNLNSLRSKISNEEVADKHQLPVEVASKSLEAIRSKLLAHRKEQLGTTTETTLTVKDWALVLRAQILRANHTGSPAHHLAAAATANKILSDYWKAGEGLSRINTGSTLIPARCEDHMIVCRSLTELYQATLDQHWLKTATEIADHSLREFGSETKILAELAPDERIIPLRLHSVGMIFGESTLGIADQVLGRLHALTGKESYRNFLTSHLKVIAPMERRTVVNHTDYISSCALGEPALVAVLQGDQTSELGKSFIAGLNAPKYLSFLTVRPEPGSPLLSPLAGLPTPKGSSSVVLTRAGDSLGQATTLEELTELLDSVISGE
ncbi:MAG: DUF255 domain-containing protein [Akkermansiaceae bacterium]|nr:DUF255 domain-containing protein [Akkermansiaceae bacterium]